VSGHLDQTRLICRVHTRLCALSLSAVREVLRPLPVQALAQPVDHVLGLSRIRGQLLPVLDVAALLGLADVPMQRYVVVQFGERRVALAVTAVLGLRAVALETVQALPPLLRDARHELVEAVGWLDAELLALLGSSQLLPDDAAWEAAA